MSEVKHTPGPWSIDPILINVKDGGQCPAYIRSGNNVIIADMNFNIPAGIGSEACTANAKLIAAAPDMLNALLDAKKHLEGYCFGDNQERTDVFSNITKAIEKATT